MFARLYKSGLKVNAGNSCFGTHKFEYLGYHVTRDSFIPIPKKVDTIKFLAVTFYRDMWKKISDILAPLTALTSKNAKYKWKYNHQKCFDAIKRVIGREVFMT